VIDNASEGESARALKGFDEGDGFGVEDIAVLVGGYQRERC